MSMTNRPVEALTLVTLCDSEWVKSRYTAVTNHAYRIVYIEACNMCKITTSLVLSYYPLSQQQPQQPSPLSSYKVRLEYHSSI